MSPCLLLENCKNAMAFRQIHAHMITSGLMLHTYPLSRILHFSSLPPLSDCLGHSYSISIFDRLPSPSIFLFNTLISSFAATDQTHLALSIYIQILRRDTVIPNQFTYPSLFRAFTSPQWFDHGRSLHSQLLKFVGSCFDRFVAASLLNFYSSCGRLGIARFIFDQMSARDLPAWNSIIAAFARNALDSSPITGYACSPAEALFLFNDMQLSGVKPNEITLVAVIRASSELGALAQGTWCHGYIERAPLKLNCFVGTALIEMYAKCGSLSFSRQVFGQMTLRDTHCYNAMINGLSLHGQGQEALDLFHSMCREGVVIDDATFVAIMRACGHAGLVDDGVRCFNSMKDVHRIEPKIAHYGCLVDLFGRAGKLKAAMEVSQRMPMKPNAAVWRSLLSACQMYGNAVLGEVVLEKLVQLEPNDSGTYVLLSNNYAHSKRWDDSRRVRKLMKHNGVNKLQGCSSVEMNGEIQHVPSFIY